MKPTGPKPGGDAELPSAGQIAPKDPASQMPLTALWFFIIGVLVIESILRLLPEGAMTRTLRHRTEEILYLPPAPIQFMGDSATNALRVSLIEHYLGKNFEISNYSLPGTTPLFCYFTLKRQIEVGRAPKLIVFAPNPFTWGDSFMDRFLGRFAKPDESLFLLRNGVQIDDWVYGTLCHMSYTLRYREELYKLVTQGDTDFIESWGQQIVSVQNTKAIITEENLHPAEPARSVLDPNNIPPILSKPIAIHPYNEIFLDKFCDLAAAHGIRIVWITLPVPEVIASRIPEQERNGVYREFVQRVAARHPNLYPLAQSISVLPNTYYKDPWHLNRYGAAFFAQKTGQQLAEWLAEHPLE